MVWYAWSFTSRAKFVQHFRACTMGCWEVKSAWFGPTDRPKNIDCFLWFWKKITVLHWLAVRYVTGVTFLVLACIQNLKLVYKLTAPQLVNKFTITPTKTSQRHCSSLEISRWLCFRCHCYWVCESQFCRNKDSASNSILCDSSS